MGYLEEALYKQSCVILESRVSFTEPRALPLSRGEEEAQREHYLERKKTYEYQCGIPLNNIRISERESGFGGVCEPVLWDFVCCIILDAQ